jgi:hypothetical protein
MLQDKTNEHQTTVDTLKHKRSHSVAFKQFQSPLKSANTGTTPLKTPKSASKRAYAASKTFKSPLASIHAADEPEEVQLLYKQLVELRTRVRECKEELATCKAALKYEQHEEQDKVVRDLVVKWRRVAQKAAEEVFCMMRNKIDKMGGFIAWKQELVSKKKQSNRWNEEREQERGEEQSEWREQMSQEPVEEEKDELEDEDDFTMRLMLRL